MPRSGIATRQRILDEAIGIVSNESLSSLCLERISERAGITKRAFYTHFPSKDHFLASLVEHQRPHYVDRYRRWADACGPDATARQRIASIFAGIATAAADPHWKGCCFIRMTAELGNMQGHPVHQIVATALRDLEQWFADELARDGYGDAESIASQLSVLINGLLMVQLVTRSASYGQTVMQLIDTIIPEKPATAWNGLRVSAGAAAAIAGRS